MRIPLFALALTAILITPVMARDVRPSPRPAPEDVDATGSVTPTDPLLVPDEDRGTMRRAKRPRTRGADSEAPIREFIPE